MRIGLRENEARALIHMWAPQMAEHALFIHLLLNDVELKEEALTIFHKWQAFICNDKMRNLNDVIPLIQELVRFKKDILARLNRGEWLGAAYPSFVSHILLELLYFADKLSGIKLTADEEVAFWNKINSDHASFASHLLDPTEEELHDKADETSKKIKNLQIHNLVLALEAGVELSEFNKKAYEGVVNNTIKSIIP